VRITWVRREMPGAGADLDGFDRLAAEDRRGIGMNRPIGTAELRRAVASFDAVTPRELGSRARFLAELDRLPDPFNREADPVHVTGSAIVVGPRGTVLHWHKRLGGWLQPGGHVDRGETPWQAALREAQEETGLPVRHPAGGAQLVHLDVHPAGPHVHLDARYLLLSADAEPSPSAEESQQVRWFSFADAIAVADAALVDGLRRVAARQAGASPCQ
jgi:8-oxo-dGTP pyrophosphatase MutT (NUDIX family)